MIFLARAHLRGRMRVRNEPAIRFKPIGSHFFNFREFGSVFQRAGDGTNRLAVIVVDEAGGLEEAERHPQTDLARLQEADGDVGRRDHTHLEIAGLGPAAEDVGTINGGEMRIAFEADADRR